MKTCLSLSDAKRILREQLQFLEKEYNVKTLGLFGSFVRLEQTTDSDLDILVTFHVAPSLLRFVELENYLADLLGIKVDLVMKTALKPRLGARILKEVMTV